MTDRSKPEPMTRRQILELLGWGAAALAVGPAVLEACGNGTSTGQTLVTAKKGGHVTFATGIDVASLNPLTTTSLGDRSITALMFDPLIYFDDNQNPVPMLAQEAPTTSADGLSYTFKLRPGLKWTDGQPLTADDVIWTYSLIHDPKYKDFNYPRRSLAVNFIDSVTAPDPQTIVIKSKSVYAPLLLTFGSIPIMPRHVLGTLDGKGLNTSPFNSEPNVSSGPFKFSRWDKGSQLTLVRNDAYYRGASYLDSLIWRVVSPTALASAVNTGDVDNAQIGVADITRAVSGANAAAQVADTEFFYMVIFNLDPARKGSQLFGDKSVRQALMYGLDRKALGDAIYGGREKILDSILPADSWAYTKPKAQYPFNKARAEQMLDTAGWKKNAQGIREKNGLPMSFQVYISTIISERVTLVEALTNQWQSIGVDASPKAVVFSEWLGQVQNDRTFDALMFISPQFGGADVDSVLSFLYASSSTAKGGFNAMDYRNSTVDQLLSQAVTTLDRSKRRSMYAQVSDIIMDELPVLPILSFGTLEVINKRVQGFKLGPSTAFINWYWMKDMWASDGK